MQSQKTLFEKFSNWWDEKGWKMPNCPISGGQNWILAGRLVEFRPYQDYFKAPDTVYPAFMITCQDCGYTIFINAAITGIV
jgi:hypothetical protein